MNMMKSYSDMFHFGIPAGDEVCRIGFGSTGSAICSAAKTGSWISPWEEESQSAVQGSSAEARRRG